MSDFLGLPSEDRIFLCRHIGEQLGIIPSIVEKDFWVCRVLNILFREDSLNPYLCFRGGTSLSKAYKIIRRFSEDIDVALSPRFFTELGEEDKPTAFQSASQRDAKLRKIRPHYRRMMEHVLLPLMEERMKEMGIKNVHIELEDLSTARDPFVLLIHYPSLFEQNESLYIRPFVKIELSGRAQTEPSEARMVDSYIGEGFPEFSDSTEVRTISPFRTFWEKCFILHENNTRPHEGWNIKARLARHYYDAAALIRAGYVDKELFFDVRDKRKLYHWQTWVDYDTLLPSDLKLIPDALELREKWQRDYEQTSAMLFDEPEPFDSLMSTINGIMNQDIG